MTDDEYNSVLDDIQLQIDAEIKTLTDKMYRMASEENYMLAVCLEQEIKGLEMAEHILEDARK